MALIKHTLLTLAVIGTLGPIHAADIDWKPLMTIAPVKRDAKGDLLPLQSYNETIRRG
ncbi:MAG: hypothetical protein RLZZ245_1332, partial [Verrucomicrobiota bacterium]